MTSNETRWARHPALPGRRDRRRRVRVAAVLLTLALSGCTGDPAPAPAPPPAQATPDAPVLGATALAGGMTEVVADRAFLDALERLGLVPRVSGQAGFAGGSGTFSFPVTGGEVVAGPDRDLAGEVRHDGSRLLLTSGTSTVALDDLVLDADAEVLTADVTVDGAARSQDLPVLAVDETGLQVSGAGEPDDPAVVRGLRLTLTAQGAEALNAALAPDGLAPGTPVGDVRLTLEPERP